MLLYSQNFSKKLIYIVYNWAQPSSPFVLDTKLIAQIFVALRRFLFISICGIDFGSTIVFRQTVLGKMAKLGYTCILEIREIRKFYSYIFNFDRIINMYKNTTLKLLINVKYSLRQQISFHYLTKMTKLGCNVIKGSRKIALDLDRYCINMHIK